MRHLSFLLAVIFLFGCSIQPVSKDNVRQTQHPQEQERISGGAPSSEVPKWIIRSGKQVEIANIQTGSYLWSSDLKRIVFQRDDGIWAVSPDGSVVEHLVKGSASETRRELVGWWDSAVVYLELRVGEIRVMLGRPNQEPQVIASIQDEAENPLVSWVQPLITENQLLLFRTDRHPLWINLSTGELKELRELDDGSSALHSLMGMFSVDERYVLFYWLPTQPDRIHILDLRTGIIRHTKEGFFIYPAWEPNGNRWAALAVVSGASGGAQNDSWFPIYASELAIGDTDGNVRYLRPPQTLKLVDGLWWSLDGKKIAVVSEVKPGSDPLFSDQVKDIWVVDVDTGHWQRVGTLPQEERAAWLLGWHPDGKHLIIGAGGVATMPPKYGRLSINGGNVEWLEVPDPEEDPTYLDERLLVVVSERGLMEPTTYIKQEGNRSIPVIAGHRTKDAFQIRGKYASWIEYPTDQPPKLIIAPIR